MSVFLNIIGGRALFIERRCRSATAGSARRSKERDAWFTRIEEHGEVLVWIGSWHLIWTPPGWSPPTASQLREATGERGARQLGPAQCGTTAA